MCRYSFIPSQNPFEPLSIIPSAPSPGCYPEVSVGFQRKHYRGPKHKKRNRRNEKHRYRVCKPTFHSKRSTFVAARLPKFDTIFEDLAPKKSLCELHSAGPMPSVPFMFELPTSPEFTFTPCNQPVHPDGSTELTRVVNTCTPGRSDEGKNISGVPDLEDIEEIVLIEHDAELYDWTILISEDVEADTVRSGPLVPTNSSTITSIEDMGQISAEEGDDCTVQFEQLRALRRLAEDDAALIELPDSDWASEDESYLVREETGPMWSLD